jgi:hypothetical protein
LIYILTTRVFSFLQIAAEVKSQIILFSFQSLPTTSDNDIESIRQLCPELAAEIESGRQEEKGPTCPRCKDNPDKRCTECACSVCGGKDRPEEQLFCEQVSFIQKSP